MSSSRSRAVIITTATAPRSLPERLRNSEIQIAGGFPLAAAEEAGYEPVMLGMNHSGEPNTGLAGSIVLIAIRDISPGEEPTTGYALVGDGGGGMGCRCGTPWCRGAIDGRDWQRPDLQRKYGSYVSSCLLHQMAQPDRRR